jgi:bifunctional DNase/RNase
MKAVEVVGVRVELPASKPVVLLKEVDGERYLPIWIGAVEASAIAFHQQGVTAARPLTHDLFKDVIDAVGQRLESVRITELRDEVFYAELVFASGLTVSARPSDAIALALRTESAIYASEAVLDDAGVPVAAESTGAHAADAADSDVDAEGEVEAFREFLDTITPEDFAAGGEPPPR